mmetsp:Transcript_398/g.776  ORF Transcript_398/g.776 Transcript_398/m.776 type:complete len:100 (-) Transcript_398:473-772(-)
MLGCRPAPAGTPRPRPLPGLITAKREGGDEEEEEEEEEEEGGGADMAEAVEEEASALAPTAEATPCWLSWLSPAAAIEDKRVDRADACEFAVAIEDKVD